MLILIPLGRVRFSGRVPRMLLTAFAFTIVLTGMAPVAGAIALPLLVILAVIWSLPSLLMLPFFLSRTMHRSRVAGKAWIASLDEPAYGVAWLAKREGIEWGSGVPFAKEVLKVALPSGTPIVAMASEPKEVRFLQALGFTALDYKGEATRAMVRRT
ncbi:hypothetical protein [Arthrobacter sp. B2a2-09]|uniref:hypothetical protein n=1 Tax=Arthrobacter sp. B2a2-09 TaxID=2952822 RepID=UPI0022CD40FA|nr:hypothetical protein [Arthrobacter sp. B2a2-09]